MDTFSAYKIFVQVIETGGFSAAARELSISKSSISKQVSQLEDHLGARLLNRTTRRLSPTEIGQAFYQRALRIISEVEEAEQSVNLLHAEPRGLLKINVPMSFGHHHVAPALAGFLERYPDIKIDMTLNDRVIDVIDEGFDVAIRIARLPDSTLIAKRLAPFRAAVVASPEYWEKHGKPKTPHDLEHHNCLIYSYLSTGDTWQFQDDDGPVRVKVSGNLRANNGDALHAAVLDGLGVLAGPSFIVGEDIRTGKLQTVLSDYMETDLSIYAVYPHNRHLSAKVRAFVDDMSARFSGQPYWDSFS